MPLRSGIDIIDKAEDGRTPQRIQLQKLSHYSDDGKQQLVGGGPVPHEVTVDLSGTLSRLEITFRQDDEGVASAAMNALTNSRKNPLQYMHAFHQTNLNIDGATHKGGMLIVTAGNAKDLEQVLNDPAIAPLIPPDAMSTYILPALNAKIGRVAYVG